MDPVLTPITDSALAVPDRDTVDPRTITAHIIRRYPDGAIRAEAKAEHFQFTINHRGVINWATPSGWARIATDDINFPTSSYQSSYGPGFHFQEDEYRFAGLLIDPDSTL